MPDRFQPQELLVIVHQRQMPALAEELRRSYPVTQQISPHVLVLAVDTAVASALQALPGLTVVIPGQEPGAALQELDPIERLFVDAWIMRMTELRSKPRAGEGLSWDAPGFIPPDHPALGDHPQTNEEN